MSIGFHLSWSKLSPFAVEAFTFRGRSFHLSWSKLSPFVVEAFTFSARKADKYWWFEAPLSSNLSRTLSRCYQVFFIKGKFGAPTAPKMAFHGQSYHLWGTIFSPLAPERPINTGGSGLRYQDNLSGLLHQGKFYAWNFSEQLFRYFQIACICPKNGDFEGV